MTTSIDTSAELFDITSPMPVDASVAFTFDTEAGNAALIAITMQAALGNLPEQNPFCDTRLEEAQSWVSKAVCARAAVVTPPECTSRPGWDIPDKVEVPPVINPQPVGVPGFMSAPRPPLETSQEITRRVVRAANIASLPQTCPNSVAEVLQYGLGRIIIYGDQRPSMAGLANLAENEAMRRSAQAISDAIGRTTQFSPSAEHTLIVEFPEIF